MELLHPWVDLECMKHNNKISIKPKKIKEDEKKDEFLKELLEDSLYLKFPNKSIDWVKDNLDAEWLKKFVQDVEILKESFLKEPPSSSEMILLKYIFLLQRSF